MVDVQMAGHTAKAEQKAKDDQVKAAMGEE
jgi:hypothetical protein